jgi:hypothetical protein
MDAFWSPLASSSPTRRFWCGICRIRATGRGLLSEPSRCRRTYPHSAPTVACSRSQRAAPRLSCGICPKPDCSRRSKCPTTTSGRWASCPTGDWPVCATAVGRRIRRRCWYSAIWRTTASRYRFPCRRRILSWKSPSRRTARGALWRRPPAPLRFTICRRRSRPAPPKSLRRRRRSCWTTARFRSCWPGARPATGCTSGGSGP